MKNNGFTLIELLAVIVILAIIALIAVPIVLNIIKETKEKSTLISVENYLRAVENAVAKESMKNPNINYDGKYTILDEGKKINSIDIGDIQIEYNGEGLKEGIIIIGDGKVKQSGLLKADNINIKVDSGKINVIENIEKSYLVSGSNFNKQIKTLANKKTVSSSGYSDYKVKSIEFFSLGMLPEGFTLETLKKLPSEDVSQNYDKSILAYYDNNNIYIYSDNLISFNEDAGYMFKLFNGLIKLDFGDIDTSSVTTMASMFCECPKLQKIDLSSWNTSQVVSMNSMFSNCLKLSVLKLSKKFDTNKVTDMDSMFELCAALKEIDMNNFDTSKVTNMSGMFKGCQALVLLDLTSFDTQNVTTMEEMFDNCNKLEILNVSNFDTSKVTNMAYMFRRCSSIKELDVSKFNTSKVTSMKEMFGSCSNLTSLNLKSFDTSEVTDMSLMFASCSGLTQLDLTSFDTSSAIYMSGMFQDCLNLKKILVSEDKWVIQSEIGTFAMFSGAGTNQVTMQ